MSETKIYRISAILLLLLIGVTILKANEQRPYYPVGILQNADGTTVIAHKGKKSIDIYTDGGTLQKTIKLPYTPTGLATFGNALIVTTMDTVGRVLFVNSSSNVIETEIAVASGANSPIVSPNGEWLYVCNQFKNCVTKIHLKERKAVSEVKLLRGPRSAAISKNGDYLYVANFLPSARADVDYVGDSTYLDDIKRAKQLKRTILLSNPLLDNDRIIAVKYNLGASSRKAMAPALGTKSNNWGNQGSASRGGFDATIVELSNLRDTIQLRIHESGICLIKQYSMLAFV